MTTHSASDGHAEHANHAAPVEHAGSLKEYATGFLLAVLLTAIPFWLVMDHTFQHSNTTAAVILGLAAVQIVVHMVYFLHMNTRSQGGWTLLALLFTLMLVVIALTGSLWVMHHLNDNMMPGMSAVPDMRNMP
jgi:cytochrome o ubiquinol oxidase operon protein cyoD